MTKQSKEILETEVLDEPDFLANVCPIDPAALAECQVCQQNKKCKGVAEKEHVGASLLFVLGL